MLQEFFCLWFDSSVLIGSVAYQKLEATGKPVKCCINPPEHLVQWKSGSQSPVMCSLAASVNQFVWACLSD